MTTRQKIDRAMTKRASLFGRELWVASYLEDAEHRTAGSFILSPAGSSFKWRDASGFHLSLLRWNLVVCAWHPGGDK